MGSCIVFPQLHHYARGCHFERLCCGAAHARSPVTTYHEAGAWNTSGKEVSQIVPQDSSKHSRSACHQREHDLSASAVLDRSGAAALEVLCIPDASPSTDACVITPDFVADRIRSEPVSIPSQRCLPEHETPGSDVEAHFLLAPSEYLGQDQQLSAAPDALQYSLQQKHQQRQHHKCHQVQNLVTERSIQQGGRLTHTLNINSGQSPLHSPQPAFQAAVDLSSPLDVGTGRVVVARSPQSRTQGPLPPPAAAHRQHQLQEKGVKKADDIGKENGGSGAAELLPYLDAASRTSGIAGTSDQQLSPKLLESVAGRSSFQQRRWGARQYSASEPSAVLGARIAWAAGASRTAVADVADTSGGGDVFPDCVRDAEESVSSSSESSNRDRNITRGRRKSRIKSVTCDGGAEAAAAPRPVANALTPRRPRMPTAAEHRALRERARLSQAALLPREPSKDDLHLTNRLTSATHWRDVVALLMEHRERHSQQDLQERLQLFQQQSNMLQKRKRHRGEAPPVADLPVAALPFTALHVAAALSRTLELLVAGSGPQTPEDSRTLAAMVDWLARLAARLAPSPGTRMRELTNIFYALVRLRHPLSKLYYLMLMNEAWKRFAGANMHRRPNGQDRSGGSDAGRVKRGRRAATPTAAATLSYNSQDMSQLLWAVARCGMQGLRDDWAASYFTALLPVIPCMAPQGVGVVLHSAARLRCRPPPAVLTALCYRLVHALPLDASPTSPPNPSQPTAAASLAAATPREELGNVTSTDEGKNLDGRQGYPVHGDKSKWAKDDGLKQQRHKVVGGRKHGSVQHAKAQRRADTVAAPQDDLQQQQQQQQHVDEQCLSNATNTDAASAPTSVSHSHSSPLDELAPPPPSGSAPKFLPVDVSMALWALATLRLPPSGYCPQLLPAIERYSLTRLSIFPEQELSNLVWALARLQYTPRPEWIRQLYVSISQILPELRPQAISTLLYSLAQMGQKPESEWLDAVLPYVEARLRWFSPQALALTVHSLAVLGCQPAETWLCAFHAQLEAYHGQLDMRVRSKVREAYQIMHFTPGAAAANAASRSSGHRRQEEEVVNGVSWKKQSSYIARRPMQGAVLDSSQRAQLESAGESWPSHVEPQIQQWEEQQLLGQEDGEAVQNKPWEQQLRRRRRQESNQQGFKESGRAAEDSAGKVLVRPSRIVF